MLGFRGGGGCQIIIIMTIIITDKLFYLTNELIDRLGNKENGLKSWGGSKIIGPSEISIG